MNKEEFKTVILNHYSDSSNSAIENFIDYIQNDLQASPDKWRNIFNQLIKLDNRENYIKTLPSFVFYSNIDFNGLSEFNNNIYYFQSEQYAIDKYKDQSAKIILDKYKELRKNQERLYEKYNKSENCLRSNQLTSFFCAWDKLSNEDYFAREAGMEGEKLNKYLEFVKNCIIKGVNFERPYENNKTPSTKEAAERIEQLNKKFDKIFKDRKKELVEEI
jgi:hypothetical protein